MNQRNATILALIIAFVAASQLITGLYLPSLPAIAIDFQTSRQLIQQTFSIYMIFLGLSQLFYGPLSDRYGRRPLILYGLSVALIGTVLAAISNSYSLFLFARILEGAGAGGAFVLARSIVSDIYPSEKMGEAMALTVVAASVTPMIAPFLGGQIGHFLGWRSVFIFLIVYLSLITVLIYWKMPETISKKLLAAHRTSLIQDYTILLKNKIYISYVAIIVFGFACMLIYLGQAPFIYQHGFHITASHYGFLMIFPAGGYMVGNYISSRLNHFGYHYARIMFGGILITFSGGIILILLDILHIESIINVTVCLTWVILGYGLIASNSVTGAIAPFKDISGTASALLGCIQMFISGLITSLLGFFFKIDIFELGLCFILLAVIMIFFSILILRQIRHKSP